MSSGVSSDETEGAEPAFESNVAGERGPRTVVGEGLSTQVEIEGEAGDDGMHGLLDDDLILEMHDGQLYSHAEYS